MAFDAGMTRAVVKELSGKLCGARIDKINQPEKDEIILSLRTVGESCKLLINSGANNARVHITKENRENPPTPPAFCIMLRKQLASGRIISVEQIGFERVIKISIESKDEMGYPQSRLLYCEIMGKYSNTVLTDGNGKILGAMRPVDFTTSAKRQILPGMIYELPPAQDKFNPLEESKEHFLSILAENYGRPHDKFITANYIGISALTAREIAYSASDGSEISLWYSFAAMCELIKKGIFTPTLVLDKDLHPIEYSFCSVRQYMSEGETRQFEDISSLIEMFFKSRDALAHTRQRGADLFKLISNIKNRIQRKRAAQLQELEEAAKKDELKLYGDLLTGNIYALKRGMTSVKLQNYYDESCPYIEIALDSRLSPSQNAQLYYKKYAKARNASVELEKQLEISKSDLLYVDSVLDSLTRAKGQSEIDEIRLEIEQSGIMGKSVSKGKKPLPYKLQTKPLEYETSGGYRVLCGKNNIQNEKLTFKTASKLDIWFHVKNAPGSHVVMFTNGEEPSERDYTEAATIAAVNSSLTESKHIAVDYTQIKNIKKPAGAPPGYVIYHTNYSAYVNADSELVSSLLVKD